jgi:hypothetical protein
MSNIIHTIAWALKSALGVGLGAYAIWFLFTIGWHY